LTLAACFAAQTFALRAVGGRTNKSESNFFSSVGRIQAGASGKVDAMILGSSITGRLPDRAQGFPGWANMGCDGGSAVDALRAMDEGILPTAPLLVIEANTLQLALNTKPTEIGQAMRKPWFKVGMELPPLSAYARPAAFFYSKLLERRTGGFDIEPGKDLGVTSTPMMVTKLPTAELSVRQLELIKEVRLILLRLKAKGSGAVIVWLPPARGDHSPPPPWILEMAQQCGIPYWDLGQQAIPGTITLTDGVHMAAPSAARTMKSLQGGLSTK
ncbi:MAG: hypothetical protein JHC76_11995, partial [Akkermansiaceae bacterium]|nr:hypothetical protein [Akkermansiaceae bacterium]